MRQMCHSRPGRVTGPEGGASTTALPQDHLAGSVPRGAGLPSVRDREDLGRDLLGALDHIGGLGGVGLGTGTVLEDMTVGQQTIIMMTMVMTTTLVQEAIMRMKALAPMVGVHTKAEAVAVVQEDTVVLGDKEVHMEGLGEDQTTWGVGSILAHLGLETITASTMSQTMTTKMTITASHTGRVSLDITVPIMVHLTTIRALMTITMAHLTITRVHQTITMAHLITIMSQPTTTTVVPHTTSPFPQGSTTVVGLVGTGPVGPVDMVGPLLHLVTLNSQCY